MINFKQFLENQSQDTQTIVNNFLGSEIAKKSANLDCKSVTRAFVDWANSQSIPVRVLFLTPPSKEVIEQRPELKGKGGSGDAHVMPVINNDAVDFTARQFPGVSNQFNNPLITPINNIQAQYQKIGGYFTDAPDWFGKKSMYLGPWEGLQIDKNFQDANM